MQEYFYHIADLITQLLSGDEVYTCSFSAESSDFVRFNRSRVRQAGHVLQRTLSLDLISGRQHATGALALSGDGELDRARLARLVEQLRERRAALPEDPYLSYSTEMRSTERRRPHRLPDPEEAMTAVQNAGSGRDLVGIYAAGASHAGFANSLGQRNWFESHSFNLDWSFYHSADKAVKASYAGFDWQRSELGRKVSLATEQLGVLAHPARTIPPGQYRVYLAPTALFDVFELLGWGGFGLRAHRTRATPLLRMVAEGARLDPRLAVRENTAEGIAPEFESAGFVRPPEVALIEAGAYRDCLVSARSAAEYGVPSNGAENGEAPESLQLSPGNLPTERVLTELDTGIYIGNLWYLNYSDRNACRTTGMTRFATFWVKHGEIQEPVNVMRFDETVYRMLGSNLVALTAEREMILDSGTYFRRSTRSMRLPGAVVDGFTFTL